MLYVILALAVVVIVAAVTYFYVRRPSSVETGTASEPARSGGGFRPVASDFHVASGEAHVYFDVPLSDGDADPVLVDILLREAVEVLRSKRSHLPLEGVSTVHAHAIRNGEKVHVGKLTLDGPGELPPPPDPSDHPFSHRSAGPDLFDELTVDSGARPAVAERARGDELEPLASEFRLTSIVEAGLRAQGIDPHQASFHDLVAGLLVVGGYVVSDDRGDTLTATKGGVTHYVELVDHAPGDHPELAERVIAGFMGRFAQSGAGRGLLFTPKYAPFIIYDRERRQPKVRFVTRERFQAFVDALTFG